jgi:2-(1,2-epoxy-1,2-dihydrophenyl)acetyl-CoA isomerase
LAFSAGHDLEASLDFEGQMMALTGASEDHRNAVRSFVAKERPTFIGR